MESVLGGDGLAFTNSQINFFLARRCSRVFDTTVLAKVKSPLYPAVINTHQAHPVHCVHNMVGEALRHEASPDQTHADGSTLGFTRLQRIVDDDHVPRLRSNYLLRLPAPAITGS